MRYPYRFIGYVLCALMCLSGIGYALAPSAIDDAGMRAMRELAEFLTSHEQTVDLDAVADACDEDLLPSPQTVSRLKENLQTIHQRDQLEMIFFPGFPGFLLFAPASGRESAQLIVYKVLGPSGEKAISGIAVSLLWELFNLPQIEETHPHARFVVRKYKITPDRGAHVSRVLHQDIVQRPLESLSEGGRMLPYPDQWTLERIQNLIHTTNWQGLDVEVDNERIREQMRHIEKQSDKILAAIPHRELGSLVSNTLIVKPHRAGALLGQKARAIDLVRALNLSELLPRLKEMVERATPGEPNIAAFDVWLSMQDATDAAVLDYVRQKMSVTNYRAVIMRAMAHTTVPEAVELLIALLEETNGQPIAGLSYGSVADFITNFFDADNWAPHQNRMKAMAVVTAPRLFAAFRKHYENGTLSEQEKLSSFAWGRKFLGLLPDDYPAPRFVLDRAMVDEVRTFFDFFPNLNLLHIDEADALAEFQQKAEFVSLTRAVWTAGIAQAREVGFLFKERMSYVVEKEGVVKKILFPEELSFKEFQTAFWHAWIQFLVIKGVIPDVPELPPPMVKLGFLDRRPYPIRVWLIEQVLLSTWNKEVVLACKEAVWAHDVIPAMKKVAEEFPTRYLLLKWLLGERIFRGLYGAYLAHLIYEVAISYPEPSKLTFELIRQLIERLKAGQSPAVAYAALFETDFAKEHIHRTDVFASAQARSRAIEEGLFDTAM